MEISNKLAGPALTIAILAAIMSIGLLDSDKAYYCESRDMAMLCERFSSTETRCYPNLANNRGYRDCSEGWIKYEKEEFELKNISNGLFMCEKKQNRLKYCPELEGKRELVILD